jgi:hypothetical protein
MATERADQGLAVLLGDMAAQKHQVAGPHERQVGRDGRRNGGQGDVQCFQLVIGAHGVSLWLKTVPAGGGMQGIVGWAGLRTGLRRHERM